MGGFGGGFLQGFAESYAREHKAKLDRNLAQRGQMADLGLKALEGARPEAQLKIITNLSRLIAADPGKKIDKDLMDISTWLTPPEGYGQPQYAPPPKGFQTGSEALPYKPEQDVPGPSLRGAGMAPVPGLGGGGASTGQALAAPPASMRPPEYRMTTQATDEPLMGFGPQAGPQPPPWMPFYSPEEKSQMAAAAESMSAGARRRGEYAANRENMPAGLSPTAQANWLQGRGTPTSHFQQKSFTDPNTGETLTFGFDSNTNTYYDQDDNEVDISGLTPLTFATSPSTVWRATLAANKGDLRAALNEYNTTASVRTGYMAVQQTDGTIQLVPTVTGSTTQRGGTAPTAPELPNPPQTLGEGKTVGGRAPAPVTRAFETFNAATERYNVMEDAYPKALKGDQQAMLNLLANHIGMTMGLQRGARITQAMYDEALQSSPWLAKFAVRFDSNGDFSLNPADYRNGVVLTEDQMRQMIDLAKVRRDQDELAYRRIQEENARGYQPPTPPKAPGNVPRETKGTVKMRAPGEHGLPGVESYVPAEKVEMFKRAGAVVVQ